MKIDMMGDVRNFHLKYGLGENKVPKAPSEASRDHRIRMVKEEANELVEALMTGDLVKIARECVDVLMVVLGTMLVYGLPINNIWQAVHAANMRKVQAPGNTKASKPTKPPGWQSPDREIKQAIFTRQGARAAATGTAPPDASPPNGMPVETIPLAPSTNANGPLMTDPVGVTGVVGAQGAPTDLTVEQTAVLTSEAGAMGSLGSVKKATLADIQRDDAASAAAKSEPTTTA